MSTLSLRKIKHDSSAVDNITLNSSGHVTTAERLIVNGATTNTNSNWGYYINPKSGGGVGDFTVTRPDGNVSWLSIDSAGRVTKPYQPAFFARGRNSTFTAISTYYTPINFSSVDLNKGSHWNNTTATFTAPVSGDYLTMFTVGNQGSENNGQYIGIYILRNDVSYMSSWSLNTGYDSTAHCGGVIPLSTGDTIKFTYYNSYGTPPTATQFTQATCYLLG